MGLDFQNKKYAFLQELGLQPENLGCYVGGEWRGSGAVITSVSPATNEVRRPSGPQLAGAFVG